MQIVVHELLTELFEFNTPDPQVMRKLYPSKYKYFPECIAILDGTEIALEKPGDLAMNKQVYSDYKSRTTVKHLVGVTPFGLIIYASDSWPGKTSDVKIVREENVISRLRGANIPKERSKEYESTIGLPYSLQ